MLSRTSSSSRVANIAHALDAGFRVCFIRALLPRASDAQRSAMKGKPMTGHASRYAIVAVEANFTLDDPDEVVGSNLWFVSALFEEYLAADAIPAIRDFRPPH